MRPRAIAVVLAGIVVAALGVVVALTFFGARDESTLTGSTGPGSLRAANARPTVNPGNVVLQFSDERETAALRALAQDTGGETASPALIAAGQAVVLLRVPDVRVPVVALTNSRQLQANGPRDPRLRAFVEYWLGRDAGP